MPRYQQLDETHLDEAQRRIFNECKAGPRGSVPPPSTIWSINYSRRGERCPRFLFAGAGWPEQVDDLGTVDEVPGSSWP
jgi:hypothetical protein